MRVEHRLPRLVVEALRLGWRACAGRLSAYLSLMAASAAVPTSTVLLTRALVDGLVEHAAMARLLPLAGCLGAIGLVTISLPSLTKYVQAELERGTGLVAKERLFGAVSRLVGLAPFEDPVFLDRLQLADESGGRAPAEIMAGMSGAAAGVVGAGALLVSLATVSPPMAALVLVAGIPVLVAQWALGRQRAKTYLRIAPADRREMFYRNLIATERAAKEVRLFGLGGFFQTRMLAERAVADRQRAGSDRREVIAQVGLGLLAAAVAGGGLIWMVASTAAGSRTVGDLTMFAAAVVAVQGALALVAGQLARAQLAALLFVHYLAVIEGGGDLPVPARPTRVPVLRTGIELRNVWFRYHQDQPWVLSGLTLTIPAGQTAALVGLNGAGKSTLVKLLCRFYDPTRGVILWDGVDLRDFAPDELRDRVSAVFQDFMDYELTAAESIGLGDLSRIDDRALVTESATQAGIHDTVAALPDGYDTQLGRRFFGDQVRPGIDLSGGQRQRVAVARALMRRGRDLVVLDEPSSGLDAEAEQEIHRQLTLHRRGRTTLLISHRLGAVRDADRIVVLANGHVLEDGDHQSLLAAAGEYARLFGLQASGYQPASG